MNDFSGKNGGHVDGAKVIAEVISYNKKNLEHELQNESRQRNRAAVNRKKDMELQ